VKYNFLLIVLTILFLLTSPTSSSQSKNVTIGGYDIKKLVKDLGNPDYQVRATAAELLGNLGATMTTGRLREVLEEDPVAYVRAKAVEALGKIGDTRTAPAVIKALADREGYVARYAITALGMLKNKKAVKPLIGVLKNYLIYCAPWELDTMD